MKNTHYIDKKSKIVYQIFHGEMSITDAIESSKRIINDPVFENGLDAFVDFSDAWPSYTIDIRTIGESIKFYRTIEELYDGSKWAFFVPEDFQYTFAKIFIHLISSCHIDIKVFRDRAEAEEWLGIRGEAEQ